MKTYFTIKNKMLLIICLLMIKANAQLYVGNGAILHLNDAALSTTGGDITLNSSITGAGAGKLVLKSNTLQLLTTNNNKVYGLEIDNTIYYIRLVNNLEIDGALTMTNGRLVINDYNLILNGTISCSAGRLVGNEESNLTINGVGDLGTILFADNNIENYLKNLTINRTVAGTVTLGNPLRIVNTVNIVDGTLNSNGNLILQSNSTGTARIAKITSGNIIGNIVTERFIQGGAANSFGTTPGKRAFRFLSHPFKNYIDLKQLTNAIDITGAGATASPTQALFTQTTTNNPSAFWYNPLSSNGNTLTDAGWTAFSNTLPLSASHNNAWKAGQGIRVLIRGTKGEGLAGVDYTASNVTLSITGETNILTNPLNYNLQTNGTGLGYGWNLIGNPLPSPIEMKAKLKTLRESNIGGVNTNLNSIAYVWNPNKQNTTRGGWDAIDLSESGNYILPMHGVFLVQTTTNNNTAFSISETDKTNGIENNLFRQTNINNAISLKMKDSSNTVLDETFIRFNANASSNFDSYDGGKLINQYALYSITDDSANTLVQYRKQPQQNTIIPLGVASSIPKNFKIVVDEINIANGMQLFLKDSKLNIEQPIYLGYEYPFSTTSDITTQGNNRFSLVLKPNTALPTNIGINAFYVNKNIQVNWTVGSTENINYFNVEKSENGTQFTTVQTGIATNNNSNQYNWIDTKPFANNNFYRIKVIDKDGQFKYSNIAMVNSNAKNSISIIQNPVVNQTMYLQFNGIEKGIYSITVLNNAAQKMLLTNINHLGGSATIPVKLNNLASGAYSIIVEGNNLLNTIKAIVD